jgi:hypothetical protein
MKKKNRNYVKLYGIHASPIGFSLEEKECYVGNVISYDSHLYRIGSIVIKDGNKCLNLVRTNAYQSAAYF